MRNWKGTANYATFRIETWYRYLLATPLIWQLQCFSSFQMEMAYSNKPYQYHILQINHCVTRMVERRVDIKWWSNASSDSHVQCPNAFHLAWKFSNYFPLMRTMRCENPLSIDMFECGCWCWLFALKNRKTNSISILSRCLNHQKS